MYDYINMCKEWLAKSDLRRYPRLKGKESNRKYTPIIADAKKSLDKAQSEIELCKERICVLNKMVNNLKSKKASMEEITEIIAVWMDTKKTVSSGGN